MTQEEEIRQAAKEAYIQHISNGGFGSKYDFVNGYIACANKYNQWRKAEDEPNHYDWVHDAEIITDTVTISKDRYEQLLQYEQEYKQRQSMINSFMQNK